MPIKFTTKGFIELWRGDQRISRHIQEREAIESLSSRGPGDYRITYPEVAVRVIGSLSVGGDTQAPSIPQNVVATALNKNEISASWDASTDDVGVTGYHVFANGVPQPDVTSGTSTTIAGLTPSTLYSITVAAFDAAGNNSGESDPDSATTPANAVPVWGSIADQDVIVGDAYTLDLADYVTDADTEDTHTYSVLSGTLPSGLALVGSIVSGTPTTAGQTPTVTFRVSDGNDVADNAVVYASWTADVTAPPIPTGLAANAVSSSQIDISWNASTDASGGSNEYVSGTQDYRLYRDGALRTTTTATIYSDTGLSASTEYDYQVSARDVELNESTQSSVVSATTQPASGSEGLLADWVARSTANNVVWAQRFTTAQDVDKGKINNVSTVTFVSNDGIIGDGCVELAVPAGVGGGGSWGRPLAPISGDVNRAGLTALSVTITNNSQVTSQFNNMVGGHFGHSSYHATWPGKFVGTDYWVQYRVKFSANRFNSNEPIGKMLMLVTNYQTPNQEIVTLMRTDYGGGWYNMYTATGNQFNSFLTDPQTQAGDYSWQPGGAYASTCLASAGSNSGNGVACWNWRPTGEWITVLIHVIPGRQYVVANVGDASNPKETGIEVWVARENDLKYTLIWRKLDYVWNYDTTVTEGPGGGPMPFGWNWLNFSPFTGGAVAVPSVAGWSHRHDQVICANKFIPCPAPRNLTAPTWYLNMADKTWSAPLNNSAAITANKHWIGASGVIDPNAGQGGGDHARVVRAWNGAGMDQQRRTLFTLFPGGHNDYYGNEAYALDLSVNEPAWQRQRNATLGNNFSSDLEVWSTDNRPVSSHSAFGNVGAEGRWFMAGMGSTNNLGFAHYRHWWEFDPTGTHPSRIDTTPGVKDYINRGTTFASGGGSAPANSAVFDPIDRQIIALHVSNATPSLEFVSIGDNGGALTVALTNNNQYPNGSGSALAIDSTNRILLAHGGGSDSYYTISLRNNTTKQAAWSAFTSSGGPPSTMAMYWHPASGAFLSYSGSGTSILKGVPTLNGAGTAYTGITWTTVAAAGGGQTPATDHALWYNKFNYIENMGNGQSALVFWGRYAFPDVWVYKLPAAGV